MSPNYMRINAEAALKDIYTSEALLTSLSLMLE
jgi:hypothetical protein